MNHTNRHSKIVTLLLLLVLFCLPLSGRISEFDQILQDCNLAGTTPCQAAFAVRC